MTKLQIGYFNLEPHVVTWGFFEIPFRSEQVPPDLSGPPVTLSQVKGGRRKLHRLTSE